MSDSFFLQGKAMPISAWQARSATVFNVGPGVIYYGKSDQVSSVDNDGTIGANGRHIFTANRWIVADEARVFVSYTPELETDMATQAELDDVEAGLGPGEGGGGVLSGMGEPDPELGTEGAFYIQIDSDPPTLYGPKTASGWGSPVTIGGGAMLSGSGEPDAGLGTDGDFYVDTDTNLLYGPKTDVWGDPIDLSSSTTGGAAGGVLTGVYPNPSFAVDMATQAELDAVAAEIEDIVGVPVIAALEPPNDTIGLDGSYYFDTSSGGLWGPKSGGAWPDAPVLLTGIPALTGVTSPTDDVGGDGDYYFQTNASTIYGPKDEGEWPDGVSFKGDQGDPGGVFVWQGAWDDATTYAEFDVTTKDGSQWISVDDTNLDNDPSTDDGSNWALTAQKGNQGEVGSGLLPGLMIPAGAQRPMVPSVMASSANTAYFAHMNPVPQDGTLTDLACYIGTSSGNLKMLIYDTGDATPTVYTQVWVSSPTAVGTAGAWQTITGVGLPVQSGQRLVFGVVADNATVTFGRGDTAVTAAAATLPAAFSPPVGACRVKVGANKGGLTYASPAATITEALMATSNLVPMIIGQVGA